MSVCRPDGLLGMATHRILHKVEPGKLKMELTDKKGTNTGEISFILQASGGRFAQSSGAGSGTGTGAGAGAGAGAAALGAGTEIDCVSALKALSQSLCCFFDRHLATAGVLTITCCRSRIWPWHSRC